jgi:hypothetical protein
MEHAVAVFLWSGPVVVRVTGEVPSEATLDKIATAHIGRNCRLKPTARVLEHLTIPAYSNRREPVCEELQDGSAYGGPVGSEGQQRASLGRRT